MDKHERMTAVRFSENIILYRSPLTSVSLRITHPLRMMCGMAINQPEILPKIESDILTLFMYTEDALKHINSIPLDLINQVMTEDEKRKAITNSGNPDLFKSKDFSTLRVSPNSPLAK